MVEIVNHEILSYSMGTDPSKRTKEQRKLHREIHRYFKLEDAVASRYNRSDLTPEIKQRLDSFVERHRERLQRFYQGAVTSGVLIC